MGPADKSYREARIGGLIQVLENCDATLRKGDICLVYAFTHYYEAQTHLRVWKLLILTPHEKTRSLQLGDQSFANTFQVLSH